MYKQIMVFTNKWIGAYKTTTLQLFTSWQTNWPDTIYAMNKKDNIGIFLEKYCD